MNATVQAYNNKPHFVEGSSNGISQKLRHAQSLVRRQPAKVESDNGHRRRWSHYDDFQNGLNAYHGEGDMEPPKSGYSTEQALASFNKGRSARNNLTVASTELKATLPSLDERRLSRRSHQDVGVPVGAKLESENRTSGNTNFPLVPQKSLRRYYSNRTAQRLEFRRSGSPSSRFSRASEINTTDPARFADENDVPTNNDFNNRFTDPDFESGRTSRFSETSEMAGRRNSINLQARMKPMDSKLVSKNGQPMRVSQITEPESSFSNVLGQEANHNPLTARFSGNSTSYASNEYAFEDQPTSAILSPSKYANAPAFEQNIGYTNATMQDRRRPFFTDVDFPGGNMQASGVHTNADDPYMNDSDSERSYRRVRDQYLSKPRVPKTDRYSTLSNTASQITPRASQANINLQNNQRPASHYYEKLHIKNNNNNSFQALPYETTTPAKRPMPVTQPGQATPQKKKRGLFKRLFQKVSRIFK
ncbi:hypothetical protein SPOG_00694 [Schizosaccharomyces cryophilus OY26]|uniref:Uncharacterized protein n=1 Tax=Schizosaccharomyces cryophilus (strain OY26 / ATCC MYA-4695 / CBS 11777 / NBRC 106824 / NRRL Y48691) TaxID=653667 RepID=S9VS63_SCHCR|nr:uncharacterized protein SPOG_00694 [Schizosaccharomyces cryophilus OY26]EPY50768.1 hypothetical protein SPOG_00694 [Schizosaccharomyces cryophilus OY26]